MWSEVIVTQCSIVTFYNLNLQLKVATQTSPTVYTFWRKPRFEQKQTQTCYDARTCLWKGENVKKNLMLTTALFSLSYSFSLNTLSSYLSHFHLYTHFNLKQLLFVHPLFALKKTKIDFSQIFYPPIHQRKGSQCLSTAWRWLKVGFFQKVSSIL